MTDSEAGDAGGSPSILDRIHRRSFLQTVGATGAGAALASGTAAANEGEGDEASQAKDKGKSNSEEAERPNVVVFFADDMGYGDIGAFGNPFIHTPNLDRMAAEGAKFTHFTCESPVCTPSRTALLTGSYPKRTGLQDTVIFPRDNMGLAQEEETIADVLSDAGYATGCFGKWHVGHRDPFLPTNQGFDTFLGIPYSNDMLPEHPLTDIWEVEWPELPLVRDGEVIERGVDQKTLTRRLTEATKSFISQNQDDPFFAYVPYPKPHLPLFVSEQFEGTSKRGLFGDVIEEMDWGVGQVLDHLENLGLDEDTLVVFASDDGPWTYAPSGEQWGVFGTDERPASELTGNTGPLRGAKQMTYEGGLRSPTIMRWPDNIPENTVCQEMTSIMDLFPTIANLAGADTSIDRTIDGKDIRSLMENPVEGSTPHERLMHFEAVGPAPGKLSVVRDESGWKYLFPIEGEEDAEEPALQVRDEELYNIHVDIGEKNNKIDEHEELAQELREAGEEFDEQLKESASGPATSEEGDIGFA